MSNPDAVRAALSEPLPPVPVPDKKAIGELLKSGAAVPGAHIETRNHLQIR